MYNMFIVHVIVHHMFMYSTCRYSICWYCSYRYCSWPNQDQSQKMQLQYTLQCYHQQYIYSIKYTVCFPFLKDCAIYIHGLGTCWRYQAITACSTSTKCREWPSSVEDSIILSGKMADFNVINFNIFIMKTI